MSRRLAVALVASWLAAACVNVATSNGPVLVERVPDGGIQPQAIADAHGVVHVVYFTGDPAGGDFNYITRMPDGTYSKPMRVNSQPRSAVATGTVRGAHLALGRHGRVHVVWNGSTQAQPRTHGDMPLLYASFDSAQQRFTPQRTLITWAGGLDGGGTVAADDHGRVYAAWHGNPGHGTDAAGAVYLARSADDGTTFAREEMISGDKIGACACCSMRALLDRQGTLSIVYRAAGADVNRDTMLLWSRDRGTTFTTRRVDPWKLEACPLSTFALAEAPRGLVAAWETEGRIRHAMLTPGTTAPPPIAEAPGSNQRKHPAVAVNAQGQFLLAWLEGSGWARGGRVAWQIYGSDGTPTADHGVAGTVPAWGLATTAALPDGRFVLLH